MLKQLLEAGTVWIEDGDYVGRAADGTVVSVGTVGYEEGAERYLSACPSPSDW